MKYCIYCGASIPDDALYCCRCGCSTARNGPASAPRRRDETMVTVVKVFLILGCISWGWLLLPLAWCVPMTVSMFNSFRDRRPISTGMKVCTLLFLNTIAGICLLCMDE